MFLLDKDLDELISILQNPGGQTEWAEICRRQFCKIMKTRPDIISGASEYDLLSLTKQANKRPLACSCSLKLYGVMLSKQVVKFVLH